MPQSYNKGGGRLLWLWNAAEIVRWWTLIALITVLSIDSGHLAIKTLSAHLSDNARIVWSFALQIGSAEVRSLIISGLPWKPNEVAKIVLVLLATVVVAVIIDASCLPDTPWSKSQKDFISVCPKRKAFHNTVGMGVATDFCLCWIEDSQQDEALTAEEVYQVASK